jgi:hypothetical protein
LQSPVDAHLGRGAAVLLRDFGDHWISQDVQVLLLSLADRIVGAATDSRVALNKHVELSVNVDQVVLLEVWMHLDLVYSGWDLAAR